MTMRALAKQRAVSKRGFRNADHVCIQEILLITENTQEPMKIMKTSLLHAVSVPRPEFSKMQSKEESYQLTKTATWKGRSVVSEQH